MECFLSSDSILDSAGILDESKCILLKLILQLLPVLLKYVVSILAVYFSLLYASIIYKFLVLSINECLENKLFYPFVSIFSHLHPYFCLFAHFYL